MMKIITIIGVSSSGSKSNGSNTGIVASFCCFFALIIYYC